MLESLSLSRIPSWRTAPACRLPSKTRGCHYALVLPGFRPTLSVASPPASFPSRPKAAWATWASVLPLSCPGFQCLIPAAAVRVAMVADQLAERPCVCLSAFWVLPGHCNDFCCPFPFQRVISPTHGTPQHLKVSNAHGQGHPDSSTWIQTAPSMLPTSSAMQIPKRYWH